MTGDLSAGAQDLMRPIRFAEVVQVLSSWSGRSVSVTISDRRGVELTSIHGILTDRSVGERIEFAVDDPDEVDQPLPLSLAGPRECALGGRRLRIATAGEVTMLFTLQCGG